MKVRLLKSSSIVPARILSFIIIVLFFVILNSCSFDWKIDHSDSLYSYYFDLNPDGVVITSENTLQITRFGISWYITLTGAGADANNDHGVFANGDHWVRGPVEITYINPPCAEVNGLVVNGAMIDPDPADYPEDVNRHQGYGETVLDYDPAYNDALPNGQPVSGSNPIYINPGSCIVSTISTPGSDEYNNHLRTASILTVLDTIPAENSFRPGYCASSKVVQFNEADLDYAHLQNFALNSTIIEAMLDDNSIRSKGIPTTALEALNNVADFFERPWLDHIPLAMGRAHHPLDNMPEYGRDISNVIGIGATMLHMDFTPEEKRDLMVRFVQLGIDLYSITTRQGGNNRWSASGGQSSGRKWPILFAGIVLGDAGMRNIGQVSGDYAQTNGNFAVDLPDDYVHFGEDDQTFYVTQAQIDAHASYSHIPEDYTPPDEGVTDDPNYDPPSEYRDDQGPQRFYPYRAGDLGIAEYGQKHWAYAGGAISYDSKYWWCGYRFVNSPAWTGFIFAANAMNNTMSNAKVLWNHDALFDYVDRWVNVTPYDRFSSSFVGEVWDTYRGVL